MLSRVNPLQSIGSGTVSGANDRGPESSAVKRLTTSRVVCLMGHTRLRIIDIHERADQPMADESGTVWITYNGELYNHTELRARPPRGRGIAFVSKSWTPNRSSTLYEELGGRRGADARAHFRGMFRVRSSFDTSARSSWFLLATVSGSSRCTWCDGPDGGIAFCIRGRERLLAPVWSPCAPNLRRVWAPTARPRLGERAGTNDVVDGGPRSDARRVHY